MNEKNNTRNVLSFLIQILVCVFLVILQFRFTNANVHHFLSEEIGESVRGPLWLSFGRVYQGLSSHLGWYSPLLLFYSLFGFSVKTAAWYRFGLHIVSLLCLSGLLLKYMRLKFAFLILLALGTSPVLLYFNSLSTHYGIDLQFIPICLFLLDSINFSHQKWKLILGNWLFFSTLMFAWMSYPTVMYYLIPLTLMYFVKLRRAYPSKKMVYIFFSLLGLISFLLPLIITLGFIQNKETAILDPADRTGIFRGTIGLPAQFQSFDKQLLETIWTLFSGGESYYFDTTQSMWLGILYLILLLISVVVIGNKVYKRQFYRLALVAVGLVISTNLFVFFFFNDPTLYHSSVRRATGFFIANWTLLILAIHAISTKKESRLIIYFFTFLLVLMSLTNLYLYPKNLSRVQNPTYKVEDYWLSQKETPQKSYEYYMNALQKEDLKLACPEDTVNTPCGYIAIYAILKASCQFNRISCHKIWGLDPGTKTYIPMSYSLWDSVWIGEKYPLFLPEYADFVKRFQKKR